VIGRHFGVGILKPKFRREKQGIYTTIGVDITLKLPTRHFSINCRPILDLMANSNTTLASLWIDDGRERFFSLFR